MYTVRDTTHSNLTDQALVYPYTLAASSSRGLATRSRFSSTRLLPIVHRCLRTHPLPHPPPWSHSDSSLLMSAPGSTTSFPSRLNLSRSVPDTTEVYIAEYLKGARVELKRERRVSPWVTAAARGVFAAAGVAHMTAGAYTRPRFSSTSAVLVTPPRVPLSNRLVGSHAPDVSHKMCLR